MVVDDIQCLAAVSHPANIIKFSQTATTFVSVSKFSFWVPPLWVQMGLNLWIYCLAVMHHHAKSICMAVANNSVIGGYTSPFWSMDAVCPWNASPGNVESFFLTLHCKENGLNLIVGNIRCYDLHNFLLLNLPLSTYTAMWTDTTVKAGGIHQDNCYQMSYETALMAHLLRHWFSWLLQLWHNFGATICPHW